MNAKIRLLITLICGMHFMTGCDNGPNTIVVKDTDSTKMKNIKYDTIGNKLNTDKMKSEDSILYAMNKMMSKIRSMKLSGDVDIDFANMMIDHQQGAIDMSLQEIKSGTDAGIKALAKKIVTNQVDEQSKFEHIARNTKPMKMNLVKNDELSESMDKMKATINNMKMTGNIDKDFVTLMIEQNESEIKMAKNEFSKGINSQLKQMAQKIIADRTQENSEFNNWLSVSK
jgi:uncharacterized protein (DUF305 family)